jgi:hypothetical protein
MSGDFECKAVAVLSVAVEENEESKVEVSACRNLLWAPGVDLLKGA